VPEGEGSMLSASLPSSLPSKPPRLPSAPCQLRSEAEQSQGPGISLCPLFSCSPRSEGTAEKSLLPLIAPSGVLQTAELPRCRAPSPDLISAPHTCSSNN